MFWSPNAIFSARNGLMHGLLTLIVGAGGACAPPAMVPSVTAELEDYFTPPPTATLPTADAPAEAAQADTTALLQVEHGLIRLQRRALGQAFLLTPTVWQALPGAQLQLPRAKIVVFAANDSHVALLERHTAAEDQAAAAHDDALLAPEAILQSWPLRAADATSVSFAWQLGLYGVPSGSGFLGNSVDRAPLQTFVQRLTPLDDGLEIVQLAQLPTPGLPTWFDGENDAAFASTPQSSSLALHMRLVPWAARHDLHSRTLPSEARQQGFFSGPPNAPGGAISRWRFATPDDPTLAPLTYVLSDNIPALLQDALREGILYWQHVAQLPWLQVEMHAEAREAPRARRILVHWGRPVLDQIAKSDLQVVPHSHEIVAANIYLGDILQLDATSLMALLPPDDSAPQLPQPLADGPAACRLQAQRVAPQLQARLAQMQTDNASQPPAADQAYGATLSAAQQQLLRDYYRLVMAHEVGHTLGLRHNFAASQQTSLASAEARALAWQRYVQDGSGAATATSVMDYLNADEAVLLGALLRHDTTLPYDRAMLAWGYALDAPATTDSSLPPSCSDADADASTWLDCQRYDSGTNPVHGLLQEMRLVGDFMQHRAFERGGFEAPAAQLAVRAADVWVRTLRGTSQFVHPPATEARAVQAQLAAWNRELGGLPAMLQASLPHDAQGLPHVHVEDAAQDNYMATMLLHLTGSTQPATTLEALTSIEESFPAALLETAWQEPLAQWVVHILLAENASPYAQPPRPAFGLHTRLAATRLLSPKLFGNNASWQQNNRALLALALAQRYANVVRLQSPNLRPSKLAAWERWMEGWEQVMAAVE